MMREADGLEETSSKEYEDKRESTEDQEKRGGGHCGQADKAPREDLENTVRVTTA